MTQAPAPPAAYTANIVARHILAQYEQLRPTAGSSRTQRPLMVSMQGPQGAGKSTIAALLVEVLARHAVRCVVASLDDFYLTHTELVTLAETNPTNALLHGRGQPGTHDVDLLIHVLGQIHDGHAAELPVFDKSQFDGEGDRAERGIPVTPPVDVFVLEGWSMGFQPLPPDELASRYTAATQKSASPPPLFLGHSLDSLQTINTHLARFASRVYPLFDTHVSLQAASRSYVYTWRLQQEHAMKTQNGGKGMSDDGVKRFVDRYMPGYELFEAGMLDQWAGRGYTIRLGPDRSVVDHHAI